jgi:hypothetical protein
VRLYDNDLLIEDLEPVAAIKTLKEINLRGIMATLEEQLRFRKAHPNLVVLCNERASEAEDEWTVAQHRVLRWRVADSGTTGERNESDESLDLRGVRLSEERLEKLAPVLPAIRSLQMDRVTAGPAAVKLLRRCPKLESLDATGLPADRDLLQRLAEMPNLAHIEVSQGTASFEDLQQLEKLKNFNIVFLYEATLTEDEASELQHVFRRRGYFDAYRGLDSSQSVISVEMSGENPFE